MARTTGPLLSMDASGTIGKTLTHSTWKGRSYVKKQGIPTNNQQMAQLGIRSAMTFLSQQWSTLSPAEQDSWIPAATAKQVSPFDAYIGENLTRHADNMAPTKEFPATSATYMPTLPLFLIVADDRFLTLFNQISANPTPWLTTIYRSELTGFTPGPANAVHLITSAVAPAFNETKDVPPNKGQWYWRVRISDDKGNATLIASEFGQLWT